MTNPKTIFKPTFSWILIYSLAMRYTFRALAKDIRHVILDEGIRHYSRIIPPEVLNNSFHDEISRICAGEDIINLIEIGSSSGAGSTTAIEIGLMGNPNKHAKLHCLEISQERFEVLYARFSDNSRIEVHRLSSISIDQFPSFFKVIKFWNSQKSKLNEHSLIEIFLWWKKDRKYLKIFFNSQNLLAPSDSGIAYLKKKLSLESFDFALIDGGEFNGYSEFSELRGSKWIALDDINSYKCNSAYFALQGDTNYELVVENWDIRNGYAIFKKKS